MLFKYNKTHIIYAEYNDLISYINTYIITFDKQDKTRLP